MTAIQVIKTAAAPKTLWMGVASVIAGWAAAAAHGNFESFPAVMCLIFCVFAQLFSNFTHRYFDDMHDYGENRRDGMQKVDDLDRPVSFVLKESMKVSGVIAAMAGLWLLAYSGWWVLIIAIVIGIFVALTNLGPYPMSQSALYPVMTFIFFGPIAVIGTCLVQSAHTSENLVTWWDLEPAVLMSIMIGLMAMKSHTIYGAYHIMKGLSSSRTKFIRHYAKPAYVTMLVFTTLATVGIGVFIPHLLHINDRPWLFIIIPILSGIASTVSLVYTLKHKTVRGAWTTSILNMLAVAVLSFIVFCIIGYPEGYLNDAPPLFN